jgi:hypothetical protein
MPALSTTKDVLQMQAATDPAAVREVMAGCKMDALIGKLNELKRTATLEYALRVGRLIVSEMYHGDLSRWRAKGERDVSFRQLAARTRVDLKMSATSLYRSLALFDLCSHLPLELWRDFGAGHLRAVLGLPREDQIRLLSMAKASDWSARDIYVQARASHGRGRNGRKVEAPISRKLRRLIATVRVFIDSDPNVTESGLPEIICELRELLARLDGARGDKESGRQLT